MTTVFAPARIYEDALDLLQQRGWCQGTGEDVTGAICLARALGKAEERHQATDRDYDYSAISQMLPCPGEGATMAEITVQIVRCNDAPQTTFEDVVLWLKQAAEQARALSQA